jgi:hypothetical protein
VFIVKFNKATARAKKDITAKSFDLVLKLNDKYKEAIVSKRYSRTFVKLVTNL